MNSGRQPVAALVAAVACVVAALSGCSPGSGSTAEQADVSAPGSAVSAPTASSFAAAAVSPNPATSVAASASGVETGDLQSGLPAGLRSAGLGAAGLGAVAVSPLANPQASTADVPPVPVPQPTVADVRIALPATAYIDVSVATLWRSPSSPRSVDAVALSQPVGIRDWLAAMSLDQRRGLNGRVDSQLLLGERVIVDREQGSWAHVVVPDQPTPLDARGYPGWIPLLQLTFQAPLKAALEATVATPTAWLYVGPARYYEVSMATRLPVVSAADGWVKAETPDGTAVSIRSSDVVVGSPGAVGFPSSGADVVRMAHLFDGLPYLWGGTSGFGFDCSGFTHLVYAMHGVTIPRDADAQAVAGTPVARADLQPGDLVFFASKGVVHHVGIYVGGNMMLHAPQTVGVVSVVSLAAQPYASEYAGARRYLR